MLLWGMRAFVLHAVCKLEQQELMALLRGFAHAHENLVLPTSLHGAVAGGLPSEVARIRPVQASWTREMKSQ